MKDNKNKPYDIAQEIVCRIYELDLGLSTRQMKYRSGHVEIDIDLGDIDLIEMWIDNNQIRIYTTMLILSEPSRSSILEVLQGEKKTVIGINEEIDSIMEAIKTCIKEYKESLDEVRNRTIEELDRLTKEAEVINKL